MREFVASLAKPDLEKPLSYLADDITWETAEGTFQGKAQVKTYFAWLAESFPDLTIAESGIGILAQGNQAFFEHVMEGTVEGTRCHWLAMCAYEFTGGQDPENAHCARPAGGS